MAENINKNKNSIEKTQPLIEHLEELKKRLVYILIVVAVVFAACYSQGQIIVNFVQAPILDLLKASNGSLSAIYITEPFFVEVKVCFIAALIFSMPFILYQLWLFIAPGLYMHERRYLYGFVVSASILFFLGVAFAYFIVFPFGFKFFLSFASNTNYNITANISIAGYVSFVVQMVIVFGIVFELPAIVFLLTKIGIINEEFLIHYRRYSIVLIFIVAAVLTPPDPISQLAMACPLLLLYQFSIYVARVFGRETHASTEVVIYE